MRGRHRSLWRGDHGWSRSVSTRGLLPPCVGFLALMLTSVFALARADGPVLGVPGAAAAPAPVVSRGVWPTLSRRRPIKPSGCCWLIACCLLSGDIQPNPGPGRDVTLLLQNVQSIKNKLGDLRQSSTELANFSIVALTETWLTDDVEVSKLESALPSHSLMRRDRIRRAGGGVACFINKMLFSERREALEPTDAEMLVVEVGTAPPMLLAVCYCPPDDNPALAATIAGPDEVVRAAAGRPVVIVGDFNVPDVVWRATGSDEAAPVLQRRTRRALELLDGCRLAGLSQHVWQPSRGPNYLDLVLSTHQTVSATVRDGVFPSDHKEVTCDIKTVRVPTPVVSRTSALNYKRADWDGLRATLRLAPWDMLDGLPVDDATDLFYDLLTAAIRDHIPIVRLRRRQPPWFDRELHAALREKEAAHRLMKRVKTPATEASFRERRRSFKSMASSKFHEYIQGLVDDLRTNPKRFWTFVKCVKGKGSELPPLVNGNRKVTDDREKAEALNKTFAEKFSDPTVPGLPLAPECDLAPLTSFYVSVETVREILSSVNQHKACGPDDVSGRVIRECAVELAVPVTMLCKLSLEQGVLPKFWKRANIVAIHKKGAKNMPH